ncbi:MAG: MoxR family ATPase, partial [Deltaproteobacteria bacterium]|nr:MoxR family ATPase [Deltaproteobacteria bacterium]
FTPDLMPSDITGSEVLEEDVSTGKRYFKFLQGPIFTNILLADEINRTPPKTQAALLQAMQEYRVTAGGKTYRLDLPFLVYATQNPIELEGTYPLPEAQLDRFMFSINIGYPGMNEECEIIKNTTSGEPGSPERVLSPAEILLFQDEVLKVPVADSLVSKTVAFVRMTRPSEQSAPDFVRDYVAWGASLRASQCLIIGGKASALLGGRFSVSPEDIKSIIYQVLEHRIIVNFKAEAEGVTSREIIRRLLESNPIK